MLEKIEKVAACACVSVMAVLVFANVIARYVFNNSLAFSTRCPPICSCS